MQRTVDRTAQLLRVMQRARQRYARRKDACRWVIYYAGVKGWADIGIDYRISIRLLRDAGYWHRDPRYPRGTEEIPWRFNPRGPSVYYEDMLGAQDEAWILCMRLIRCYCPELGYDAVQLVAQVSV